MRDITEVKFETEDANCTNRRLAFRVRFRFALRGSSFHAPNLANESAHSGGSEFAFPDDENPPAKGLELSFIRSIACAVAGELHGPESDIGFRHGGTRAAAMLMPEASMHEYDSSVLWQHDVGLPRQSSHIGAESEAITVEERSDNTLRLRVLSTD